MNNMPIGVFDSGIGGLTVLKRIIEILPNEKYIYYADTNNVPYGTKPKEEVKKYITQAVEFLISKNVKAIVIACNTATSIAVKDLRNKYNIPIIGIEPAVKPAVENRGDKRVLIMATPTTIKEEKLKNLIEELEAIQYVDLVAMPKLVEFAEKGDFNSEEVKEYIKEQLEQINLNEYSKLVLGCTHFPFFKETLYKVFPDNIQIIDGSLGVANRLKNVLEENNSLGSNLLDIKYYYSGRLAEDEERLHNLLLKRLNRQDNFKKYLIENNFLENKKAIIFDFDGTLSDSIGIWNIIDYKTIKEMAGVEVDLETIKKEREKVIIENKDKSVYEKYTEFLVNKYNMPYSLDYVINRRREIAKEYIIENIDYKQDADRVLKKLKYKGYILVLATTTARRTIDWYTNENKNLISKAKFDEIFDLILSNDDVTEKKPSPEIYLKVLEILNLKKEECIVVEDSIEGVMSAKAAGIEVLNIPDSFSVENQEKIDEMSDFKLKDFREFLELIK